MRLPDLLLALPLGLLACAAEPSEGSEPAPRDDEPSSHLARYPGAPFEDRDGNLWITTVLEGLLRWDGEELARFTTADGLPSDAVRDVLQDEDGTLWVATTGGVARYDGASFEPLTDYRDTRVTYTFTKDGDHRDVWDLQRDRDGALWIATCAGVFRLDGDAFVPFPLPVVAREGRYEFTPRMVYCVYEDDDGALWFGTDGAGAMRYDGAGTRVYTEEADGLCSDRVCAVLRDRRGDLWFGTSDGGVSRFDGRRFTTHLRSPVRSEHFGWGRTMAMLEDRSGGVWFGLVGGAARWDGEGFRTFSRADGLGDGGVPSIRADRDGDVWLGTTAGVFRFDGARFHELTKEDVGAAR